MSTQLDATIEEGITFFGNKPSDVLAAFHASGLSASGFSIAGRIVPQKAQLIENCGANSQLFNGETRYAAMFVRSIPAS